MLSPEEAKQYYDQFGVKQDEQDYYEGPAFEELFQHGQFEQAQQFFEFGCGTGNFAKALLTDLPNSVSYVGCDISSTMVELSQERLSKFGEQVQVNVTNGSTTLDAPSQYFDRFISNYVVDLLPKDEIQNLISEAHRILKPEGLLCLISITKGSSLFSKWFMGGWRLIHALRPRRVGGCRPLLLREYISNEIWSICYHNVIEASFIPSEIIIAKKYGKPKCRTTPQ